MEKRKREEQQCPVCRRRRRLYERGAWDWNDPRGDVIQFYHRACEPDVVAQRRVKAGGKR